MKKENNLDRILKYFVNEKPQRNTTASILKFKLFKEDLEQEEINELLLEIHNHRPRIVESSVNSKGKVFAKPIISKCQEFLDEGGFEFLSNRLIKPNEIKTIPNTRKNSAKKEIILKFWKIISENALISGLILLLIGILLTKLFG